MRKAEEPKIATSSLLGIDYSNNERDDSDHSSSSNSLNEEEEDIETLSDDETFDRDTELRSRNKKSHLFQEEVEDDEDFGDDESVAGDDIALEDKDRGLDVTHIESSSSIDTKLKKMTPKQLAKEEKRIKRTGVCYLSRIPPFMKPVKLRSVLSRFGKIDRLFLKPEDTTVYRKRVKYGGNKKKNFTEGWIEFVNKKDAKLCAETLNGNKLGGKKGSYYYDDVINIKYLSGFKWFDLTQQIAKENEIRNAKLSLELSRQQKLNKSFIHNVEKSKMVNNIKKKRKEKEHGEGNDEDVEMRRNYKQRKVTSTRADAKEELKASSKPNDKLHNVLSKVF
ncbi:uncharacterized protein PRCAT00003973001 [Priceomyces carsonii]|uniref:uncharacterized protein n=1 Tax=Priceomyces carsonii TaxID=28549 RepID=UPI002ED7E25E|nr:unnamed protein product [Priceomyces carsonii]